MTHPVDRVGDARAAVSALLAADKGSKSPPLRPLSANQIELLTRMQNSYEAQIDLQKVAIERLLQHLKHDCPAFTASEVGIEPSCEYLREQAKK